MKKTLIYGFGLMLCLTAGCKKDAQNNKIYLLKTEIDDDRVEGGPIDTTSYTYDNENRVTNIVEGSPPYRLSFLITYDSEGRVDVARKMDTNGALLTEYDFYYKPGVTGYYFHAPNFTDTAVFIFNSNNQVTRLQTQRSGYQLLTYDTRGNVATSVRYEGDGSNTIYNNVNYVYDDKKNPFSQMAPNNLFFKYIVYPDPSSLINNITNENGNTFTYTYNSDGFPTKILIDIGQSVVPVYYNYIVK
jgi:YD repeat-containing protein